MTITQLNFKTVSQENPLFNDKIIIQISKKMKFLLPHKSILFAINKLFRPVPSRVKIQGRGKSGVSVQIGDFAINVIKIPNFFLYY